MIFLDLEMKSMLSLMKIHPFFFRRGNQFFFKSKDIKETFSSLFLFIMSCANGCLAYKSIWSFLFSFNYLIQFYYTRSNLVLFQKDSEQAEKPFY